MCIRDRHQPVGGRDQHSAVFYGTNPVSQECFAREYSVPSVPKSDHIPDRAATKLFIMEYCTGHTGNRYLYSRRVGVRLSGVFVVRKSTKRIC